MAPNGWLSSWGFPSSKNLGPLSQDFVALISFQGLQHVFFLFFVLWSCVPVMAVQQIPPKHNDFKHQSLIIFYSNYGPEFRSKSAGRFWLGVSQVVALAEVISKASSFMSGTWSGKTQIAENWAPQASLTISM